MELGFFLIVQAAENEVAPSNPSWIESFKNCITSVEDPLVGNTEGTASIPKENQSDELLKHGQRISVDLGHESSIEFRTANIWDKTVFAFIFESPVTGGLFLVHASLGCHLSNFKAGFSLHFFNDIVMWVQIDIPPEKWL